jgi:Tol biopolymer transport system component
MTRHLYRGFFLLSLVLTVSCSDNSLAPGSPSGNSGDPIKSLVVDLPRAAVFVGGNAQMTASVSAAPDAQYTLEWSVADTTVAKIDPVSGILTALAPGVAYPRACAIAHLASGSIQKLCAEGKIQISAPPARHVQRNAFAFVRNETIFVSTPGSDAVAVIHDAVRPSWSPDESRIAFLRYATNQLCIANNDGSDVRCVTEPADELVQGKPSWSPDGSTIAFSLYTSSGRSGLLLLDVNTMKVTPLKTPAVMSASWSPDGRTIAIVALGIGGSGLPMLATVNTDGSGLELLASLIPYSVQELSWSPDGGSLAFTLVDENGCPWYCDTAVGVANADGSNLRILAKAHTCFGKSCSYEESYIWGAPEWIESGATIAYTVTLGSACYGDDRVTCGTSINTVGVNDSRVQMLEPVGGLPSGQW